MFRLWAIGLVGMLLTASCSYGNGNGGGTVDRSLIDMDRTLIVPACAILTSCSGGGSLGQCVEGVGFYANLPKFMIAELSILKQPTVALMQNIECVVEAGSNCDQVYACMNGGNTVKGCTPGTSCRGKETLVACVQHTEPFEVTLDCAGLGLECVQMIGGMSEHVCATEESRVTEETEVTCTDNAAKMHISNVSILYDCDIFGGGCYPGVDDPQSTYRHGCVGPGGLCNEDTFQAECDGDKATRCYEGREGYVDCAKAGMNCYMTETAVCSFSDCDPFNTYQETCESGVITFCGMSGIETLNCTDLGFSGCTTEGYGAWCVR